MQAIIALLFLTLSTIFSWLGMIYGWGILPENWLWIIGVFIMQLFCYLGIAVLKD